MTILNPTNQKATLVKTDDGKRIIVDELMVDSKTGVIGKGYSPDNGKTLVVKQTIKGNLYDQDDANKLSPLLNKIPIDSLKLRSPNGTVFLLSVDDDGKLATRKVGESSEAN